MKITVNGHNKTLTGSANLKTAIGNIVKDPSKVIAELNGKIIKKELWTSTSIKEGDKLELVAFVGGG